MVTMLDVANRVGVSVSTVSRVLNNGAYVDEATARRVREAMAELGYRPNLLARGFRRKETRTIGLLVPDNSNPFFAELARAIEDAGFVEGYSVVLCNSDLSAAKQNAYVDVLVANRVDGLIFTSTGLIPEVDGVSQIDRIVGSGVPFVIIDRDLGAMPVDQLLVDHRLGGYLAGDYLVRLGHRRIACLLGPDDRTPSAGRTAGFKQALAEAGIALAPGATARGNGRFDGGVAATQTLLQNEVDFSAIFAFNDIMAIAAISVLQRAGRRAPDDVSVVGFDDIPMASAIFPPLTTVAQPIAEMGRRSVRMLLDRIADRAAPPSRVVLPTTFVERESCRAWPIHGDRRGERAGSRS